MGIEICHFFNYLNNNPKADFEMFLNDLADDKGYPTIIHDKDKIVVNEPIHIQFHEEITNKFFRFENIIFNEEVKFQGNFSGGLEFYFKNVFFKKINLLDCTIDGIMFDGKINNIEELDICDCNIKFVAVKSNMQGSINLKKCKFEDFNMYNSKKHIDCMATFTFNFCEFKKVTNFMNFTFKNRVSFTMSRFKDDVYFNNSRFYDYIIFRECKFEKTASFYGVKFNKTPTFSQVIFEDNLNMVNADLNFDFENLQTKIKEEYENFNKNKEERDKKSLDKFANDFRDSFRLVKNILIKEGNLLDASSFHKFELYCKEIELKQSWNHKGKNVKNKQDLTQNAWSFRDLIDSLLLGFYRKLCDHHTDFLKVFNNLVLLIALYALFILICLCKNNLQDTKATLALFHFLDNFKSYIDIGGACVALGVGILICEIDKNLLRCIKYFCCIFCSKKWKEISVRSCEIAKIVMQDARSLMKSLIFTLSFVCVSYIVAEILGAFLNLDKYFGYSLLINTLFVGLYIGLVYTKSVFFGRYVIIIASYVYFFITLIENPSIIHPLIGKIADTSSGEFNHPSLIVLNISYTILIGLVLFSLQKTARKNSIVPS